MLHQVALKDSFGHEAKMRLALFPLARPQDLLHGLGVPGASVDRIRHPVERHEEILASLSASGPLLGEGDLRTFEGRAIVLLKGNSVDVIPLPGAGTGVLIDHRSEE